MNAFASHGDRVIGGPSAIAADAFNRFDEHVKDWRWDWYRRGVTIDRSGWKRDNRTGEIINAA